MMSDSAKRNQASTLRGDSVAQHWLVRVDDNRAELGLRPFATEDGQESRGFPPVGSARRERRCAPIWFETLLHIKGFGGGVPPNTETAAVNPRAGIE